MRIRWVESAALAAWVVVVILGVAAHEPWWDEAQAWLLARDAGPGELLWTRLGYEGHPFLWYAVLMPAAKMGAPYVTLNVLSALIGLVGVAAMLLKSRAPVWIRVPLAFSFFLAYQFTVVARSYVLLFPLLLAILLTYDRRGERFVRFCALLALLSQVSVHGAFFAAALFALFLIDRVKVPRRAFIAGLALLVVDAAVLFVTLRPREWMSHGPDMRRGVDFAKLSDIAWSATKETFLGITVPAIVMFIVVAVWLWFARGLVEYVLMTLSILPISAIYMAAWHEGVFFFALVFAILLAFERGREMPRAMALAGQGVIVIVFLGHTWWTFASLAYDAGNDFTGSRAAAEFVREHGLDQTRLYGTGLRAMEIQPYFPRNVFRNYHRPYAFWDWTPSNPWPYRLGHTNVRGDLQRWLTALRAERPDYIVSALGYSTDSALAFALAKDPAYRAIAVFEGRIVWKDRAMWQDSFVIYERGTMKTSDIGVRTTTPR